ncbi:MAG TPA: polysaccharide deacetylase family protein [Acidimicrobiia bacterium]|nr:polysaccharide deacetylase family protein [Acidimicrobiia bacterium]
MSATGRAHTARSRAQRVVKSAAGFYDQVRPRRRGVVVLAYHRVGGRTSAREIDLPVESFDAQLELVAAHGVASTLDDALVALTSPEPDGQDPVVVTFDDGTADFVDVALPLLVRHDVPAIVYLATDFIESGRAFPHDGLPVSWSALRDALSTGLVTLGSHTHSHALLDRVDAATATRELDRSIELIGDRTGVTARHFAYPKALTGSAPVREVVRSRFRSAAIAGTRANRYGRTDPYRLARSPVQRADGLEWFGRKLAGGLRLEDDVRRLANRIRYIGAST